jgi:tetratricopeptide (TPR) repeat protein
MELQVLSREGKLNLVPMYGSGLIEKPEEYKLFDVEFIEDAIKINGSRDSAIINYNKFGWSHLFSGDIKTSMKRFNQVWLLDSNNASCYFGFNVVLNLIKNDPDSYFDSKLVKIKEVENAQKYYVMGQQRDFKYEHEKKALLLSSMAYTKYGMYEEAIISTTKLLEFDDRDSSALDYRETAYLELKQYKNALEDLLRLEEIKTAKDYLYNDFGYCYQNLGDTIKALEYYSLANKMNPNFLNPVFNSTMIYLKLNQLDDALIQIEKCLLIKNDIAEFHRVKGGILLKMSKKDEAIISLKKAKSMGDKEASRIIKENK